MLDSKAPGQQSGLANRRTRNWIRKIVTASHKLSRKPGTLKKNEGRSSQGKERHVSEGGIARRNNQGRYTSSSIRERGTRTRDASSPLWPNWFKHPLNLGCVRLFPVRIHPQKRRRVFPPTKLRLWARRNKEERTPPGIVDRNPLRSLAGPREKFQCNDSQYFIPATYD